MGGACFHWFLQSCNWLCMTESLSTVSATNFFSSSTEEKKCFQTNKLNKMEVHNILLLAALEMSDQGM